MIPRGVRSNTSLRRVRKPCGVDTRMAVDVGGHRDRLGHADRIGQLHSAARRQSGSDDVLREPAGGVGAGPIHLGRVLAGEGAAAVRAGAAIRVDDDLPPGEARVALRAANLERAGRIDQYAKFGAAQFLSNDRQDNVVLHGLAQCAQVESGRVLCRENNRIDDSAVLILVTHGHLRLGVRPQEWQRSGRARFSQAAYQLVREPDRQRHQRGGLCRWRNRTSFPGRRRQSRRPQGRYLRRCSATDG